TTLAHPQSVNSLQADFEAGRQTEVDARNMVIVRLGARHGIGAPMNLALASLLMAASTRN
ncbi:2-dehydropantoate 2-reductase, partial [Salmonella enterica subsp. enterica serovar Enteritidis]|nr:2-dehydropantoate 2-reductase [Salmonella enterica subsp. enterica serovar Enteritidis]